MTSVNGAKVEVDIATVPENTEEAWAEVERLSLENVIEFLRDGDFDSPRLAAAKVAQGLLSAKTRREQTRGAQAATHYQIARDLAQNKEQLATYVRLTMPEHPIVKALPAGEATEKPKG